MEQQEDYKEIREIQKELLALLSYFNEICKANNIKYSLHGGTLLGAVREHGFIPWDDDLDIVMTRDSFSALNALLKENSRFQIYGHIKNQFRHVDNNRIWIDIFILDYISSGICGQLKLCFLSILDAMCRTKKNLPIANLKMHSLILKSIFLIFFALGKFFPTKIKQRLYYFISCKAFPGKKEWLFRSNDSFQGRKLLIPCKCIQNYTYMKFEDLIVPVIEGYDYVLKQCYGNTYMTPVRDTKNHTAHIYERDKTKEYTHVF